jgi:tetraacyldisaccharide 4'-kinase
MVFWEKRTSVAILLYPFSIMYRGIVCLRRFLFKQHIKRSVCFAVPIIVVGNITVGGTGKTPFVIWLARFLTKRGLNVGIVSRGYGGSAKKHSILVRHDSSPVTVGDEAVMIVQQTHCPMAVGYDRPAAVARLVKHAPCDVIISDDGLQHYALDRLVEIAVIDAHRLLGNGFLLPAGSLREPPARLASVDCVIFSQHVETGRSIQSLEAELKKRYGLPHMPLMLNFNRRSGIIYQIVQPAKILQVKLIQQPIHALAGIAYPERFFNALRQMQLEVIEHRYPDHHVFCQKDIDFGENDIVIMTEKDAVKCQAFADTRHWCLPLELTMSVSSIDLLIKMLKRKNIL